MSRLNRASPIALFLLCILIYLITLNPTVTAGDSGELITLANHLGVAHPPGYPLYLLIGKLFTLLPGPSIAWKMNFFSAFCSSLTTALLYQLLWRWTQSRIAAIASALLYAFSPLVWRYSVTAEVFALNQLLIVMTLRSYFFYLNNQLFRNALLCTFLCGLGMSHHQTFLFTGLPIFIFIFFHKSDPAWGSVQNRILLIFVGLAGFFPYLYLFWAADHLPQLSWGDTSNLMGFMRHLLRTEYGTLHLSDHFLKGGFWNTFLQFFINHLEESLFLGSLGGVCGTWSLLKERSSFGKVLLTALLFSLIFFHIFAHYPETDAVLQSVFKRFWLQPYLLIAIIAAPGIANLLSFFKTKKEIYFKLAGSFLLLGATAQILSNFKTSDQKNITLFKNFGELSLKSLPPGAIFLPYGDLDFFISSYLQNCEGLRPDVTILSQGRFQIPWYQKRIKTIVPDVQLPPPTLPREEALTYFITHNSTQTRPLSIASQSPYDSGSWKKSFHAWPYGFTDRVLPQGQRIAPNRFRTDSSQVWGDFHWLDQILRSDDPWANHLLNRYQWSEYRAQEILTTSNIPQ